MNICSIPKYHDESTKTSKVQLSKGKFSTLSNIERDLIEIHFVVCGMKHAETERDVRNIIIIMRSVYATE
jgi:hypothetical protein